MKKFLKYTGLFILSILSLCIIILSIQNIFSYTEKSFNIPIDFFNMTFEDKEINSEENGFKEYVQYNFEISKDNVPYYFEEQLDYSLLRVNEKIIEGTTLLPYEFKWLCNDTKQEEKYRVENCKSLESHLEYENLTDADLKYNGKEFNKVEKYLNEKISLAEEIKNKDYIKIQDNLLIGNSGHSIIARNLAQYSIECLEAGDYRKGLYFLQKFLETERTISQKMYNVDGTYLVVHLNVMSIYYNLINRIIENYDIPKAELEKLLTELKNPIRQDISIDSIKLEYKVLNKNLWDNFEGEFEKENGSIFSKLITKILYNKEESRAIHKKVTYEYIINGGNISNSDFLTEVFYNSMGFSLKNINNFFGRFGQSIIVYQLRSIDFTKEEKDIFQERELLIEKLKTKIENQKDTKTLLKNLILNKKP